MSDLDAEIRGVMDALAGATLLANSFVADEERRSRAFLELKLILAAYPTWRESDLRKRCAEIALAPESTAYTLAGLEWA